MDDLLKRLSAALAGRYAIESELGRGGMAVVYRARDLRHERDVALKVLPPHLASAVNHERFLKEIRLAARLAHPYIVPILDSGETDGLLYYVMPVVDGETLRERLAREGALPVEEVRRIAVEVAEALAVAHDEGVVHRDVKPSNILLTRHHALLTDFGVARGLSGDGEAALTGTGVIVGTPAYMSPQQALSGDALDGRSDQYALGCVIYEMLTGDRPFDGPSPEAILMRHATEPLPPVRSIRPETPEGLAVAVERAMAKDPEDRFDGMTEFREALAAGPDGGVATIRADPDRPLRRAAGIALVGLTLAAGAWWLSSWMAGPSGVEVAIVPCQVNPADAGRADATATSLGRWLQSAGLTAVQTSSEKGHDVPVVTCYIAIVSDDSVELEYTVRASDSTEIGHDRLVIPNDNLLDVKAFGLGVASSVLDRFPATTVARAFNFWRQGDEQFMNECFAAADSLYDLALEEDPELVLARLGRSDARRWQLETSEGHASLRALYDEHGEDLDPGSALLLSAVARPPPESFDRFTDGVLAEMPNNAYARSLFGDELLHRGALFGRGLREARDQLQRAVELDPGFGPAWDHLAQSLILLGDSAGAARAITSIPVVSDSCQRYPVARLWRYAWLATFAPDSAGRIREDVLDDVDRLGAYSRLSLAYFDLPGLQLELGRALRESTDPGSSAWHTAMNGIAVAQASLGRPDEALLTWRAAADSAPDSERERARLHSLLWAVVPPALEPGRFPAPDSAAVPSLERLASETRDSMLRARALWALGVAAPHGDTTIVSRLREQIENHDLDPRMLLHLEARDSALAEDYEAAVELSAELIAYDRPGRVTRPFNRAAFYLQRGEWYAALARRDDVSAYVDSALAAWMWHENIDFEGVPGRGVQAGEIDDALASHARLRRAELASEFGRDDVACAEARAVLERWRSLRLDSVRRAALKIVDSRSCHPAAPAP